MAAKPPPPIHPSGGVPHGDDPSKYIRGAGRVSREISAEKESTEHAALLQGMEALGESQCSASRPAETIRLALRLALRAVDARWGCVWIFEQETERLRLAASEGTEAATCPEPVALANELAQRALRRRSPLESVTGEPAAEALAILALPIVVLGCSLGAIAVARAGGGRDKGETGFDPEDRRLLRILAGQCGIAMHHAQLSDEVREAKRRLQEIQRMLLQSERLAALGEMSAKVAHEIRNPLSGIGGFARRIEKGLAQQDPNRKYASIIVREIQRLETLLNEQLLFAQRSHPHLSPIDLGTLARETAQLVREEVEAKGVRLIEHYQGGARPMLLDGDRVKQVILNILKNAIASTRQGNRIRLATRSVDGWAQIEIANDGERLPGEILDSLFIPFATARSRGCGLGLAVADQIVKEHGGEIRVRSSQEWSVLFVVSLPILGNAERRTNADRRRGRDRRRAA